MLRLEEEDDLGTRVRDPVGGALDQPVVRHPDSLVPARDPRFAVRRLAEDVEAPRAGRAVERPRLVGALEQRTRERDRRRERGPFAVGPLRLRGVGAHDVELEPFEGGDNLLEALGRHRDLEVLVLAALLAEEELEGPAGRDVPRSLDSREPPRDLFRMPGLPLHEVGIERLELRDPRTLLGHLQNYPLEFRPHML